MITINEVRSELRRAVEYGEGLRNAGPEHDRALGCARRTLEIVEEYEKLVRRVLNLQVPIACPNTSMSSATLAFSATWPISSESTGGRSDPRPGSPGHGLLCTQEVCRCQRFNRSRRPRQTSKAGFFPS